MVTIQKFGSTFKACLSQSTHTLLCNEGLVNSQSNNTAVTSPFMIETSPYQLSLNVWMNYYFCIWLALFAYQFTVVTDWESIKPHLWSKLSLFKTSLQMLEEQIQLSPLYSSLPYLRPFQWGTVSPYISRGIKNMTSRSWKIFFY